MSASYLATAGLVLGWSFLTIGIYLCTKRAYRRWRRMWLMPVALTPLLLIGILLGVHTTYHDYMVGAGWLVTLVGPATVAFAVPIYENRVFIRDHWPILLLGILVGSLTAVGTSYGLATLADFEPGLRASLLPRSFNTPFAMAISGDVGGTPSLTAFFVVITGLTSAVVGHLMVSWLPVRSAIARGALLGMAGHAAGTAKAFEFGREEGTVAGLVMILAGLINVVVAPQLIHLLT